MRKTIETIDASSNFKIETETLLNCGFKSAKTVQISLNKSDWNYRNLSVLINKLKDFNYDQKKSTICRFNPNKRHYYFFKVH